MIILYVALFVFILPPSNSEKDKHHDKFIFIDHHTYEQCHIITSYLNVFIKRKDPYKIPTSKGLYLRLLLINVSNDVNPNPGPASSSIDETIYPCGTCDQPVTWENSELYVILVINGITLSANQWAQAPIWNMWMSPQWHGTASCVTAQTFQHFATRKHLAPQINTISYRTYHWIPQVHLKGWNKSTLQCQNAPNTRNQGKAKPKRSKF